MCLSPTADSHNPLTWSSPCAIGTCKQCPSLQVESPPEVNLSDLIELQVWRKGPANRPGKDGEIKEVYGLFKDIVRIEEAKTRLEESSEELKEHIYISHVQWESVKTDEKSLLPGDLLTIEDYQVTL